MTWFDMIPDEYQEHLPGPGPTREETFKGVAKRGFEEGTEPFLKVGEGIKDSLRRIYKVAAQPIGAAEPIKPRPFTEPRALVEFLGGLVGYIASAPVKIIGDLVEKSGELRKGAARTLLGGPRGELGEWTPEQMEMSKAAVELTLGAMLGGGPGAGTGPVNIALRSTGKGAKRVVGAFERLAQEYRTMVKPIEKIVELSAGGGARKGLSRKAVEFIHRKKITELAQMKESYPVVTKGLRSIPQEALDLVKDIGLAPLVRKDIAGRFRPPKSRAEYQIGGGQRISAETIPHEIFHATQIARMKAQGVKKVTLAMLEAHTYEFEPLFLREVAKLPKGKKMSMETWNQLYDEAFQNMLGKYGTDFSKYKMSEIVSKAHLERNWDRLVREGELKSVAPSKIGEMVETPYGKAKYDGPQPGFGSIPDSHMYTFQEGIAKGGSFNPRTQRPEDVAKAAKQIVDVWTEYTAGGKDLYYQGSKP